MSGFLRFVGLANAAVWLGSAIFLTVGLPALFSPELKRVLTPAGVGLAAESIIARYFIVQYWCGGIALAHLLVDWIYFGRPIVRINVALIGFVLLMALVGGEWIQPKMRLLHVTHYFGRTLEQQMQAGRTFSFWHAISEGINLLIMGSLFCYLWRLSRSPEPQRFVSFSKIRS